MYNGVVRMGSHIFRILGIGKFRNFATIGIAKITSAKKLLRLIDSIIRAPKNIL